MNTLKLCYDVLITPNVGYPNLARHQARLFTSSWRQFDHHWPRTVPLRLLLYLEHNQIEYTALSIHHDFDFAWYPIGIGWFDHDLDYVHLLSDHVKNLLRQRRSCVLFYYHEGDDPARICQRLDSLFVSHGLPVNAYVFVSANSAARYQNRFVYFPEHECFFSYVNRDQQAYPAMSGQKSHSFTALNRTPKSWRVSIMADLHRRGHLRDAIWSLDTDLNVDADDENPLEIDSDPAWAHYAKIFRTQGPYLSDTQTDQVRNDHHWVNDCLYRDSYFQLILETHFDADQSGGTFLTEKTFKCLKYGQPFFLAGPSGSLQELKNMGYDVYDQYMDTSYDAIADNTLRWHALRKSLEVLLARDLDTWHKDCINVVSYNQTVFRDRARKSVKSLLQQLATHRNTI